MASVRRQESAREQVESACRRARIPFEVVRDIKQSLQEQERLSREREIAVRQRAWQAVTTPGCWPFWRFGFRARWGELYDNGDATAVPGYDLIHQAVASEFPEYEGELGEYKLFELLFSPWRKLTRPNDLWWNSFTVAKKLKRRPKLVHMPDTAEDF
jgi:hypothetical protein